MWHMDCKVVALANPRYEVIGPADVRVDLVFARFSLVGTQIELNVVRVDLVVAKVCLANTRVDQVYEQNVFSTTKVVDTAAKVSPTTAMVALATITVIRQLLEGYPMGIGKLQMEFDHMHQE